MNVLPFCVRIGLAAVVMLPVGPASAVNARNEIYLGAGTTGGVLVGSNAFQGSEVVSNGTVTINGQRYDASGQWARSTIDFNSASPYLGIGWGHHPGFGPGFFTDVGFIYGRPSVSISVSSGLRQVAGDRNIAAELASLQRRADHLRFFPMLRMGLDFHW